MSAYRLRISDPGATTMAGNVAVTILSEDIADVPEVGGQEVDVRHARTASRPWTAGVLDTSGVVGEIGDAEGRAQMLRRLVDWSLDDGAGFTVQATGRLDGLNRRSPEGWNVTVSDERLIERTTRAYEGAGNTTRILPPGPHAAWRGFPASGTERWAVTAQGTVSGQNYTDIRPFAPGDRRGDIGLRPAHLFPESALEFMKGDVKESTGAQGNFQHLRANLDGTDREIWWLEGNGVLGRTSDPVSTKAADTGWVPVARIRLNGTIGTVGERVDFYLHALTAPPSEILPRHIGGEAGVDPATEVSGRLNTQGVRRNAAAFTALTGKYGKAWMRLTEEESLADYVDAVLYEPEGVAPFINADGEVAPSSIRLPTAADIPDVDTLPLITVDDLAEDGYPTWEHGSRELTTVVNFTVEVFDPDPEYESCDGIKLREVEVAPVEHDNLSDMGRHELSLHIRGMRTNTGLRSQWARDLFDRFGDGPVYSDLVGMKTQESREPGEFVRLDVDSFPNLATSALGGIRVMQVIQRALPAVGATLRMLDTGPALQAVTAPTLSAAQNSGDPRHSIDVTISGLGTGERAEIQVAKASTEPAADSEDWRYRTHGPSPNGVTTVPLLQSGETYWFRARASRSNRIRSAWSTADDAATDAITAPTSLVVSDETSTTAKLSWTAGDTDLPTEVLVAGTVRPDLTVGAGRTEVIVDRLPASTTTAVAVRHVDPATNSRSSNLSGNVTTTSTAPTLAGPDGVTISYGELVA